MTSVAVTRRGIDGTRPVPASALPFPDAPDLTLQ